MTSEDLLAVCFPDLDPDQLERGSLSIYDFNEETGDVLSMVDVAYRTVLVWPRTSAPGAGVVERTRTIKVASLSNVCTDPDYRGQGRASALIRRAHEEAAAHPLISFAALVARPGTEGFYRRLGYRTADASWPEFLVCPLREEAWPQGRVERRQVTGFTAAQARAFVRGMEQQAETIRAVGAAAARAGAAMAEFVTAWLKEEAGWTTRSPS